MPRDIYLSPELHAVSLETANDIIEVGESKGYAGDPLMLKLVRYRDMLVANEAPCTLKLDREQLKIHEAVLMTALIIL